MLERLADHASTTEPPPFAGPDHPMRRVTRTVAFEAAWSDGRAKRVGELFDGMATEWSERDVDDMRSAPVLDALERGALPIAGGWLELGSGTGAGSHLLAPVVGSLVAADLSLEMLRCAPVDTAPRVQADASALPFPDDSFDAVAMINMLLFPHEVDRILRPGGMVLWINNLGDQTPIHLPSADVLEALPGNWSGRTANAGTGFWLAAHRE